MVDLFDFVGGGNYSAAMPPPERLSVMIMNRVAQTQPDMVLQLPLGSQLTIPAKGITLKELGVMKLTAQSSVRYGFDFWCGLWKRVYMNPLFQFLNPSDSRSDFYNGFTAAYSRVLKPSKKLKKFDACTATVLEGFFHRLHLFKLEEGVETAMIDLHGFVYGVDCFAHMADDNYSAIMDPPERPSMMINQLTQIQRNAPAPHEKCLKRSYNFPYAFGGWISLKELDLMKKVVMKPQFKFMEPTNSVFGLYNVVVDAYSRVVKPSDDACTETVLSADASMGMMQTARPEEPEAKRQKFDESALNPEGAVRRHHSRWQ
ncbi:putative SWAP/Surp superfamily protein [Arabidopsis thaliana]